MLPTTQEYKISLMIGQDSFRTLEGVEVIPNPNYPDEPWYSTGGLAIVFKLKLKDKLYALKCFYTEANERQERLGLIAAYLKQNPSPYFVDFTYLENELWVETANDEGQGYPVVLMEWVEGKTLDNYLEQICTQNNTPALKNLYFQFCNLAWWLQQQPIAHGDIKHDNLIVTPDGKLKLIDYDGVFVPALRGRKANEMGSPCYQHPKRDAYFFDKNLDDFSLLVLQITLLALQHQPKFFTEHYNGDGIILKDSDYQNFAQSPIKTILWQLPEVKIPLLLSQLQGNINNLNAIDLMPLLQDVAWINWLVGGQKDEELEFERKRLKEVVLKDKLNVIWRRLFFVQVTKNYPLTKNLLDKYKNNWFWDNISENTKIIWSVELLETFENRWNWWNLSKNSGLPWGKSLIEKYKSKWNWLQLSQNIYLPWSEGLIEEYKDYWDWRCLSGNSRLPWTLELIEKYENKWNWGDLGFSYKGENLPWTIDFIEKYKYRWKWEQLSANENLSWSLELIEKYKSKWNWEKLSSNNNLPWSIEFIDEHKDKWNWGYGGLSDNLGLPWTMSLIEKYKDKWDWNSMNSLSSNRKLPWSIELIEKYKHKWGWVTLSSNKGIPWSVELLIEFEDKWSWNYLATNDALPWSENLFHRFFNKWGWGKFTEFGDYAGTREYKGLSNKEHSFWTLEIIEQSIYLLDWGILSKNNSIPWSIAFIDKYINKWSYNKPLYPLLQNILGNESWKRLILNKGIYEKALKPLLNDDFIDEIMSEM